MTARKSAILGMMAVIAALLIVPFMTPAPRTADAGASSCGNGIIEPGEECDSSAGTPCSSPFGGQVCDGQCDCIPGGSCGNGVIDAGETCDPPGSPQPPNGNVCRSDCTYCGDSMVNGSPAGVEVCDDGNSGACPNAVDNCANNCTLAICKDPARIIFKNNKPDQFSLHGLISPTPSWNPSGDTATIEISNANGTFLSVSSSSVEKKGKRVYLARVKGAHKTGGVALFKIVTRPNRPAGITIKAFGDLSGATLADMTVTVSVGGDVYSVSGTWRQLPRGWNLPDSNLQK